MWHIHSRWCWEQCDYDISWQLKSLLLNNPCNTRCVVCMYQCHRQNWTLSIISHGKFLSRCNLVIDFKKLVVSIQNSIFRTRWRNGGSTQLELQSQHLVWSIFKIYSRLVWLKCESGKGLWNITISYLSNIRMIYTHDTCTARYLLLSPIKYQQPVLAYLS